MPTVPAIRPPFRADHVGSLLRPAALRAAFKAQAMGGMGEAEFEAVTAAAIREVVRMQEEVGLEVVTDGEFRRGSYWGRFVERIDGFAIRNAEFKFRDDHGHVVDFTAPHVTGKVRRSKPLALDEYDFVKTVTTRSMAKITLPAPSTMHFYRCANWAEPGIYASPEEMLADLAQAFREEIADLARSGCRYIQLDEVAVAMLCDPSNREQVKAAGQDPDRLVGLYIQAINDAIATKPADMLVGVHMCRGNFKGHYLSDGGYDDVAERFFTETKVTHFLLEYDTPRAGDFKPLRFVPKDKGVVLGLVSSKVAALESLDDLVRRTHEAAAFTDLDRLGIGPQCGFASTVAGNPLTETDQRAKLARIVEATRKIWG